MIRFASLPFLLLALHVNAATLVYTNDLMGELEPCGCRNNPQGGLARQFNLHQKRKGESLLQLDAGDLLFSTAVIPEALQNQAELQAEYLIKAKNLIRQDAAVPGEKDFALGVKAFEKLRKQVKFKFLAANLLKKGGKPLLDADATFTVAGASGKKLKVAVLGLVGEDLNWPKELKVTPAIAEAKKRVPALRKKADVVIALTHQGYEKDVALGKAVAGIDYIVGGHSQSFLQIPPKEGSALILQSSFRNQYVGLQPLKSPSTAEGHELIGLDAEYESPPETPSPMDTLIREMKAAIADLNSKSPAPMTLTSGGAPKFQTFVRCGECHLKQFDFWRKTQHAKTLQSLIGKEQGLNKECISCHSLGFADKEGFLNVNRLADFKPETLPQPEASTTPSGEASPVPPKTEMSVEELAEYLGAIHKAESIDEKVTLKRLPSSLPLRQSLNAIGSAWAPVQCENCHAPGRDHPFSGSYSKAVSMDTCLSCHTRERAPEWHTEKGPNMEKITQKKASIACPAGELEEKGE